jgi:hypothetical protein
VTNRGGPGDRLAPTFGRQTWLTVSMESTVALPVSAA